MEINELDKNMVFDRRLWHRLIHIAYSLCGIRLGCCCIVGLKHKKPLYCGPDYKCGLYFKP